MAVRQTEREVGGVYGVLGTNETSLRTLLKLNKFQHTSALALYLSLSAYFFAMPVILHPSQLFIGMGSDPSIFIWSLVWWPHALWYRLNPLICRAVWAPIGTNLAWAVSIPAPSIVFSPITHWLGPIASYNLLCLLAPATAAWAAFSLCHYITKQFLPALLGGYIFGFSTYMLGQMLGHLFLVLVFPIPIAVLLVLLELDGALSRNGFVVLFALMLVFEFLTSTEVFASATVIGILAIALAMLTLPADHARAIKAILIPILSAYAATALIVSPYLYYVFFLGEPAQINSPEIFSADLLNFFFPTGVTLVRLKHFASLASRFTVGDCAEATNYIGIPLLLLIVLFAVRHRFEGKAKFLLALLALVCLASLGPVLHIAGSTTRILLPWKLCSQLPLIDQILPARLSLFAFLILGIIAALFLSDSRHTRAARAGLAILVVLSLWPDVSLFRSIAVSVVNAPAFISDKMYKTYLRRGETIVVLPWGEQGNDLLWQALSGMYFNLAEGYLQTRPSDFSASRAVRYFVSGAGARRSRPLSEYQLSDFLAEYQVGAIVVDKGNQQDWPRQFASLGVQPTDVGGVLLYQVPEHMLTASRLPTPALMSPEVSRPNPGAGLESEIGYFGLPAEGQASSANQLTLVAVRSENTLQNSAQDQHGSQVPRLRVIDARSAGFMLDIPGDWARLRPNLKLSGPAENQADLAPNQSVRTTLYVQNQLPQELGTTFETVGNQYIIRIKLNPALVPAGKYFQVRVKFDQGASGRPEPSQPRFVMMVPREISFSKAAVP